MKVWTSLNSTHGELMSCLEFVYSVVTMLQKQGDSFECCSYTNCFRKLTNVCAYLSELQASHWNVSMATATVIVWSY